MPLSGFRVSISSKGRKTGLALMATDHPKESCAGRNVQHSLAPLLRQSAYSRLAGYDDTNDAVKLPSGDAGGGRHARRLVFQLAEVAVPRELFQGVLAQVGQG